MPSSSETCGRVAWKSKKPSGRSRRSARAPSLRQVAAGERSALAAVVPAAEGGDQHGPLELRPRSIRSSSATRQSTCGLRRPRRTPQSGDERDVHAHTAAASADVHEHEPPGQCVRYCSSPSAIWTSTSTRTARRAPNSRGAALPPGGEVAEDEQEREPKTPTARRGRRQRLRAARAGRRARAAAGVRARPRSRARPSRAGRAAAATTSAARRSSRHERPARPARSAEGLEREHDRAREHGHREQEVRGTTGQRKVGSHGEVAERRLRERAERRRQREPAPRRGRPGRGAASRVSSTKTITTPPIARFPNSMNAW